MYNPFREEIHEEEQDRDLTARALGGDSSALESLVLRHQSWIYNIALRMLCDVHDAEDTTQEVLVKIITKLALYDPEASAFRTWLYRIVVNHIINREKNKKELLALEVEKTGSFEKFASRFPDRRSASSPDLPILRDETKMACLHCMLLYLNRRERAVFILGVVFDVTDAAGAEILEISRDNFRKILSRSRGKLHVFFTSRCSLLNEENSCRCEDRLNSMIRLELVNPEQPLMAAENHGTIGEIIQKSISGIEDAYYEFNALFRSQPLFKPPDATGWLRELLARSDIKGLFTIQ